MEYNSLYHCIFECEFASCKGVMLIGIGPGSLLREFRILLLKI